VKRGQPALALTGATIHLGDRVLPTAYGPFAVHFFRDLAHARTSMAVALGDLTGAAPVLARVHSSCVTSECLGACDCDCAEQLDAALAAIAQAGRGLLFYLVQEGRGAGLAAKARDRMLVQASRNRLTTFEAYSEMGLPADLRTYHEVAPITRLLGVRAPLRLLTNNPEKAQAVARALAEDKIEVCGTRPIHGLASPFNSHYLEAKARSGHRLGGVRRTLGALPPDPVIAEPPMSAIEAPHLVSTARYWLPVSLEAYASRVALPPDSEVDVEGVAWLSLRVVFDRRSGRESILLRRMSREPGAKTATARAADFRILGMIDRLPTPIAEGRLAIRQRLHAMRGASGGALVVDFDETGRDAARLPGAEQRLRRAAAEEMLAARWPSPGSGTEIEHDGD
jgi:GTP cyclohydrolase II